MLYTIRAVHISSAKILTATGRSLMYMYKSMKGLDVEGHH